MNKTKKIVLITGAKGFVGKHLIKKLKGTPHIETIEFDIEDGDISSCNFNLKTLDHIIHLAGITYVPLSWEDPYSFYKTNVLGTVNILELCREKNASLTYISAYVYGEPEYLPIDEKHPLKATNPYMHSKIQAESVCRFFSDNYNVPITIIRPFNVYGPKQPEIFLIPKIIKQVLSDASEISVFSLSPKRDFVYIDDLVESIILSLEKNYKFEIFNVGSGISVSVEEVIKTCMELTNSSKRIICENYNRKNEISDVIANIDKANKMLNWYPLTSFEKGLTKIIANQKL